MTIKAVGKHYTSSRQLSGTKKGETQTLTLQITNKGYVLDSRIWGFIQHREAFLVNWDRVRHGRSRWEVVETFKVR